jgi:hypothetical protein
MFGLAMATMKLLSERQARKEKDTASYTQGRKTTATTVKEEEEQEGKEQ